MKNGQALIFVFLLLTIVGILVFALTTMWQSAVKVTALERDGLEAFYLAQAGLERGRIIFQKIPNSEQPSIFAASSISKGISWKKPTSNGQTEIVQGRFFLADAKLGYLQSLCEGKKGIPYTFRSILHYLVNEKSSTMYKID